MSSSGSFLTGIPSSVVVQSHLVLSSAPSQTHTGIPVPMLLLLLLPSLPVSPLAHTCSCCATIFHVERVLQPLYVSALSHRSCYSKWGSPGTVP
jgi:hypothetical protein